DDHALFREGLIQLLSDRPEVQVVAQASNAEDGLALLAARAPDVVLLDIGLPGMGGLAALARIKALHPAVHVLILTMHKDEQYLARALAAGASGYMLKESASTDELVVAVAAVFRGETFVGPGIAHLLVRPFLDSTADTAEPLTARQRQVLTLLARGLTVKQVAATLQLGTKTVESHRALLMEKLGLRSTASLVLYAVRNGLVSAGDALPEREP
ncbi:MAG: response regulator transcription factor, partial [Comamonadaceae bacterium]